MRNDSQTIWNENKRRSEKQKRLDNHFPKEISAENDLRFAAKMATVGNDREVYNTIFGRPGEFPCSE